MIFTLSLLLHYYSPSIFQHLVYTNSVNLHMTHFKSSREKRINVPKKKVILGEDVDFRFSPVFQCVITAVS